jgi:hypothetical protein
VVFHNSRRQFILRATAGGPDGTLGVAIERGRIARRPSFQQTCDFRVQEIKYDTHGRFRLAVPPVPATGNHPDMEEI